MRRYLILLAILAFFGDWAISQDMPDVSAGVSPTYTYNITNNFDAVDAATGRLSFKIPLVVDHSQRGNLNFSYSLFYTSSSEWVVICHTSCAWYPSNRDGVPGVTFANLGDSFLTEGQDDFTDDLGNHYKVYYAAESSGAIHHLGTVSQVPWQLESFDGSGIQATGILTSREGIQFSDSNGVVIKDPNGNEITGNEIALGDGNLTDTVGRTWSSASTSDFSGCPVAAVFAWLWTVPGVNGGNRIFKFCYSQESIQTNLPTYAQYAASPDLLTGAVLPDGTYWRFDYDNYGNVTKIYLPTGGTITYGYNIVTSCEGGWNDVAVVSSRIVFDGTNSYTWRYRPTTGNSGGGYIVTDPLSNDTVYTSDTSQCDEAIKTIQLYSGSSSGGTLLKTVTQGFQYIVDPYLDDMNSLWAGPFLTTSKTMTLDNGMVNQVQKVYDAGFTFDDTNPGSGYYNTNLTGYYGLVTLENDYDYGSGAPGTRLTQKYTWYMATEYGGAYLSSNLLDLVSQQSTYGNAGQCCFVTYYLNPA